jgi:hypothetical protein
VRSLVYASILLVGFLLGALAHRAGLATKVTRAILPAWAIKYQVDDGATVQRARAKRLKAFPPNGRIAIVGDSHVELADWTAVLGVPTANFGISGSTVADVLSMIDLADVRAAPNICIMVGTNDMIRGVPVVDSLARYRKLLQDLGRPAVVFSIPGTAADNVTWATTFNAGLRKLCEDEHLCRFADLASVLVTQNGVLLPDYTWDGTHYTVDAYKKWAGLMYPVVQGALH